MGEPPPTKLEVFEETATKKVITKAFASDWEGGWRYTVNCYRGCIHGCTYCFARQYHEYLGYGAGTDFETKIVVKPNAPLLLRQELKKMRDKMPHLDFSFATDPYLPLEASYELTRKCLEVCVDFQVPVGVITKAPLVTRDIDLLRKLKKVTVFFSLPFLTKERSNPFEPYTPVPEAAFSSDERDRRGRNNGRHRYRSDHSRLQRVGHSGPARTRERKLVRRVPLCRCSISIPIRSRNILSKKCTNGCRRPALLRSLTQ